MGELAYPYVEGEVELPVFFYSEVIFFGDVTFEDYEGFVVVEDSADGCGIGA